jgi:hypothetical protein
MKGLGIFSLVMATLLLVVYVGAWVDLFLRYGPAEAVRIGFTLWPGNVVGFVVFTFMLAFGICGIRLLEE